MVICVPPIIAGNTTGMEGNQKKWNQVEKSLPVAVIMLLMNQIFVPELLFIFGIAHFSRIKTSALVLSS